MATTIINGVNTLQADLQGKKVEEVRAMLAQALNISPEATPEVNSQVVEPGYVLGDGDELEFVKPSGTKGR
jgi:hypothetical protein